ncbi:hypothetical protein F4604DRAFT_1960735 [Suillus subluteus]|nr:hypothetical protein F4604DRAFT_1960735 [Suillus subluteus]
MPVQNPNEAIRPDFTTQEHQDARQQLIDEGFTVDQAARSLAALWTLANNANKECWALERQCQHDAEQREEDEEEECRQLLKDEQEAAHLEERKKNKNKYAPLYALRKLKAGDYCKLHYFTNRGLEEAKVSILLAEPDVLVMLPAADGLHSWVPAAAVKDLKAPPIVRDENLSWEDFNEAIPCMIASMKMHNWPEDRVSMHIQFWVALQTHHWRHAPDVLKQRALLLYQAQQRRWWHMTIGTAQSWSLEELNQDLITEACEELFNEKRDKETALAIQQAASAFIAGNQDLLRTQPQTFATSQKRPHLPTEDTTYSNKKYVWEGTRTAPLNALPRRHGISGSKPSLSTYARGCGPKMESKSAQVGNETKAAPPLSTTHTMYAQGVEQPPTVLKRRNWSLRPPSPATLSRESPALLLQRFQSILLDLAAKTSILVGGCLTLD